MAASRSTFSSTEMESGLVSHIAAILRVASPQTKKEEYAPFSRIKSNSSVYGPVINCSKCAVEIWEISGSTTAITSMPASIYSSLMRFATRVQ